MNIFNDFRREKTRAWLKARRAKSISFFWFSITFITVAMAILFYQEEIAHGEMILRGVVEDAPVYGTQEHMTLFANQYGEGWQRLY